MPKIDRSNRSEVRSELEVTERTPGWKIFEQYMDECEKKLILEMESEEHPNKLLRSAGALKMLHSLRRYVPAQIDAIRQQERQDEERNRGK